MGWIVVGTSTEVPVGDMKRYTLDGVDVTVYHLDDGWYANTDVCTHQDVSLAEGDIE